MIYKNSDLAKRDLKKQKSKTDLAKRDRKKQKSKIKKIGYLSILRSNIPA